MARVLLDEGLPLRTAQWLRNLEIDALHAREAELTSAPDAEMLAFARNQRRACFTLDHDFHSILAETGATTPSVVLLRVQHTYYIEVGQLIVRILEDVGYEIDQGAAVTATRRGIRFRLLPLK
jgi:predicted nuclease of predicted toxin-antitoxin system